MAFSQAGERGSHAYYFVLINVFRKRVKLFPGQGVGVESAELQQSGTRESMSNIVIFLCLGGEERLGIVSLSLLSSGSLLKCYSGESLLLFGGVRTQSETELQED